MGKCVGRQLGIDDSFNLCSLGKPTTAKIVQEITNQVVLPDVANPPPQYSPTAEAYIGGIILSFGGLPVFSVKSTNAMTYWGLGLPWGPLGFLDTLRFFFLRAWALAAGHI